MNRYYSYLSLIALSCSSLAVHAMDLSHYLIKAAQKGNLHKAQALIAQGADVNARNSNGETALMWAALFGYKNIAQLLLNYGAHINAQNIWYNTALMWATEQGHKDMVKFLLEHGADAAIRDSEGETALDYAREGFGDPDLSLDKKEEYKEMGRLLLEALIKQEKTKGAQTAVIRAAQAQQGVPAGAISR